MVGYRGMTFCDFYVDCSRGHECERALTEEVKFKATQWWGGPNAPIAFFINRPGCFSEKVIN